MARTQDAINSRTRFQFERRRHRISQTAIAQAAGVSQATWSRYESAMSFPAGLNPWRLLATMAGYQFDLEDQIDARHE